MIKKDSKVKIHYTLTVDGNVEDSSEGKEPLAYVHGRGELIPGLEEGLEGMEAGDKKQVSVAPENGYGAHNPDAIQKVPREAFAGADELIVGEMVLGNAGGREFQAKIIDVDDKEVTLDLNHVLAGKILEFSVEIVEVA